MPWGHFDRNRCFSLDPGGLRRFVILVIRPQFVFYIWSALSHDLFSHDSNSDYKRSIRQLYKLGLISPMPKAWKAGTERRPQDGWHSYEPAEPLCLLPP